ncbi:MAG: ATP-binding protein, partial [Succinatimonas sp.]|nr:ATP-binding protein [Succinatimonas sp.]
MNIKFLIGETTVYDKKQQLEIKRPKSWLKSVSAFTNGEGGTLLFGISDDDHVVGLADAEGDAEKISEEINGRCQPFFPLIYKVLHLCFLRGSAPSAFGGFPRGFLGPQRCSLWRAV